MSLRADQKALVFFGAVAVLGAGVRVVRAAGGSPSSALQPALDRQIRSSDSAHQASRTAKGKKKAARRLDIDVATAAQIDSLPGVTPLMAKRIVADRMARGPFLSADGLRRVVGVGSGFLKRVDTLITFSGTFVQQNASDTIIPKKRRKRGQN